MGESAPPGLPPAPSPSAQAAPPPLPPNHPSVLVEKQWENDLYAEDSPSPSARASSLLDKSAQHSWSFYAEDSPSPSDCWEQVLVEKQWENDQRGEPVGHMEHDGDCCDWRGVLCMLNVCCASCT
jgi:hypothetical protein